MPELSAPQFVGREREVAALDAALERPTVVLIDGEAGIGKTRLLREFLAAQAERGCRALVGSCPELRVPYTLGAVVDAVRDGVDGVDGVSGLGLSGLAGALRPLFPEWAAELPAAPEPLEDATAARHRLFRAFAEVLSRLDVALLVLEDLHWADEATLEFLLFLVSRRPQPVSLVLTYRREEVPPDSLLLRLSSRLPADAHLVRLTPQPLDLGETAAVVSSMLADEHVSAEFAAFLHERTEGIPLAVEESVRLMHDRADLIRRDGGWARRRLDRIEVPPTIRDGVLERVGRLGPETRTVLYALSVLSGPADHATLTAVTGLPEDRFLVRVAEALGSGLLREDRPGQLSFRHPLTGHAVYEAIPVQERSALHLRAGRALEDWPVPPVAELARHFRLAGDAEAACRYTEQAADLCAQSGDMATSALLLHSLVTTVALPADALVRLVANIRFKALHGSDPYSEIVQSLRSALQRLTLTPEQEALVRFQTGRVLIAAGEVDAGWLEIREAMPHLAAHSPEAARARLLLALPYGPVRPVSEHLEWLNEATEVAPSLTRLDRLRQLAERALVLLTLGEESGWAVARRIPDDASAQDVEIVVLGHSNVGEAAMRWGHHAEAEARLARSLALAERYERLDHFDTIASLQVRLDWFTGAWAGLAERAARLSDEDSGVRMQDRCAAALVVGLLQAATGDREAAEEQLRFAGRDDQQRVEASTALAQLRLRDGDIDEALRLTDEPAEITIGRGIWPRATEVALIRADALVAAGRLGDAADLVAAFERTLDGKDAPAPRASVVMCHAILAEGRGQLVDAAVLFAEAADAWQALPRPYYALLAREHQARCLLASGQDETGVRILSEVAGELSDLGARDDADRVLRVLNKRGRGARTSRGGRPSYGDRLSPRELEVARLLVDGRTNRQIADALMVSTHTVGSQVRSAMRKLRVATRTALATRLMELGLVGGQRPSPAGDE
ncbi:ATP-binding protein [Streptomyces brasiliensis]|uniref:LuxR family transcriptional regulator n=1 Tax=Streptomyces brasiliensis TaxID=1954 RepID=A0A917PC55_9ACTN|nr:AAA family ATPase [Streptomyces brasiliensis]GGJ70170.1 LuxR family transcriptional regulator [Streptomyces brasiliensis]